MSDLTIDLLLKEAVEKPTERHTRSDHRTVRGAGRLASGHGRSRILAGGCRACCETGGSQ